MIPYAGIGSRKTPPDVLEEMTSIGRHLAVHDFMLRSGGADGADTAFEQGARNAKGKMEIYLPWQGFNGRPDGLVIDPGFEAIKVAATHHPNWGACSLAARKLHIRNVYQVLGSDLKTPSRFIICWTEGGKRKGGTGQALRIADTFSIPIYDLAVQADRQRLMWFMEGL
jgi:hypothetical protein